MKNALLIAPKASLPGHWATDADGALVTLNAAVVIAILAIRGMRDMARYSLNYKAFLVESPRFQCYPTETFVC